MSWNYWTSKQRIEEAWDATSELEVRDLVRETSLENLPTSLAYRV